MTKSIIVVLVMFVASLVAAQDDKNNTTKKSLPDLSGVWVLDFQVGLSGKTIKSTNKTRMIVRQQESEIRFTEDAGGASEQELTYYSDGRGEENISGLTFSLTEAIDPAQRKEKLESKTKWVGDKLVARALLTRTVSGHTIRREVLKEWKLTKDGKKLTVTLRITSTDPNAMSKAPATGPGMLLRAMPSEAKQVYFREGTEGIK